MRLLSNVWLDVLLFVRLLPFSRYCRIKLWSKKNETILFFAGKLHFGLFGIYILPFTLSNNVPGLLPSKLYRKRFISNLFYWLSPSTLDILLWLFISFSFFGKVFNAHRFYLQMNIGKILMPNNRMNSSVFLLTVILFGQKFRFDHENLMIMLAMAIIAFRCKLFHCIRCLRTRGRHSRNNC